MDRFSKFEVMMLSFMSGAVLALVVYMFLSRYLEGDPPPPKPCVQEITLSEFKELAHSLDLCYQSERDMEEDMDATQYTWDRIMLLDRYIKDAPDDMDRMLANRICEECENNAEEALWDYKFYHEGDCWCAYGPESDGPYDPCAEVEAVCKTDLDMANLRYNALVANLITTPCYLPPEARLK